MSEEAECDCPPEGLPAYMGTFADLMALLMCFFVLLLSFAEMDVLKFKQIAGSMKFAFGVQNKVHVRDIPKGTSIIAKEFSPGKPQPTVIQAVMQQTVDVTRETLDFDETDEEEKEGQGKDDSKGDGPGTDKAIEKEQSTKDDAEQQGEAKAQSDEEILKEVQAAKDAATKAAAEAEALAQDIAGKMAKEISEGQVELLAKGAYVVIRIREKGSFGSASDTIKPRFIPVINKIEKILDETEGEIRVAGHTDSIPINDEYFRSNWELSGGRAASVTRELLKSGKLKKERFVINGYAETKPIADNKTSVGRATNRRVEIIIVKGEQPVGKVVGVGINSKLPETNESTEPNEPNEP